MPRRIRRRPRRGLPSEHGAPRDPLAPIEPAGELLWRVRREVEAFGAKAAS